MNDPTHAPGWRGKPRSYADLTGEHDEADRLERLAVIGCGIGAAASLIAALITGVGNWIMGI